MNCLNRWKQVGLLIGWSENFPFTLRIRLDTYNFLTSDCLCLVAKVENARVVDMDWDWSPDYWRCDSEWVDQVLLNPLNLFLCGIKISDSDDSNDFMVPCPSIQYRFILWRRCIYIYRLHEYHVRYVCKNINYSSSSSSCTSWDQLALPAGKRTKIITFT